LVVVGVCSEESVNRFGWAGYKDRPNFASQSGEPGDQPGVGGSGEQADAGAGNLEIEKSKLMKSLSVRECAEFLSHNSSIPLIDVRTPAEYGSVRAKGVLTTPWNPWI
jgi:hypothetical protein